MAFPIVPILTTIGSLIADPIKRYQERKTAKHTAEIKRIADGDNNAAEADRLSIATRGWKDEYLLLITTIPLVLSFFPGMVVHIEAGFAALANLTEYYWYALALIYIDTFGFRRMLRVAVERWVNYKFGDS